MLLLQITSVKDWVSAALPVVLSCDADSMFVVPTVILQEVLPIYLRHSSMSAFFYFFCANLAVYQ